LKKVLLFLVVFLWVINVRAIDLAPNAKSSIIIEASTGEVLYENNSHLKLAPASMTKMMSLLIIMESIEKGIIKMDDMITISENASKMGGSQILLETGEQMSVEDLLKGITVASGNDAVVALAETIGGTEENFVAMMNDRAREIGLTDTNFKNCHGLDEENHYSSAHDMALIAKELVEHKKILEFSSIYETYLRKGTDKQIWLVNTNKLVRFKAGVDGLKTGYTSDSGYCLTATMEKDGMRIIAVVMGEPDSNTRNSEVSSMLDYAFSQYSLKNVLSKNIPVKDIKLDKYKKKQVAIYPKKDINVVYKKLDNVPNITFDIDVDNIKNNLKENDTIGKIKIYNDNNLIDTIDLIVKENIDKLNYFELLFKNFKEIIIAK